MKWKTLAAGTMILFFCLVGGVITGEKATAQETIRLGFVADVSGVGATFYKGQKAAVDLFIEEINAAGGVMGKKLEVVVRDAQLKPDIGANMARELILSEKCDFLIGPTSSAVALAVTKVAKEFKKIVYFHTSNAEALTTTDFQPYMFQVVPNTGIEGRGIANYMAQKPYKKYGYIGPDYAYGHDQFNAFKGELAKLKPDAEIVEVVWVKLGETNYSPYIPTLMAKNPEAIFSSLWGGGLSTFIKQAKPYGIFGKAALCSLFDLDMLRVTGQDMPEGLLGYARCPFYAVDNPEMKAFVKKYYDKNQEWPADWAIMAYDGLIALTEAIKKANSTDSDKVVKALEGMKFKSLRGERYIRAEDHMANVGIYVGVTTKSPDYKGFLIMKDVVEVPAEKIWLPVEQVKKLQEGKK
ncbi:ABC transporter substrate-binding protein [Desulfomonile tiedjei]|uniref:Amino acid/amide ABC transporter substrate-binding protein, HAAT family n=1 Tax=Desulfomonile tiedjei (strain ATCC 49306 / DSM 6799 / DCB-1) TaxID=706587 RepID=I4CCI4_DESTA|nr:ABC transporter substrate-binding protein [Desulfomonile tiedjei]AFM27275.1 amino acid/amide ABC transporter substrate-binding protein, HAAT family [Desulfomonile tiedjei DSM 6799]